MSSTLVMRGFSGVRIQAFQTGNKGRGLFSPLKDGQLGFVFSKRDSELVKTQILEQKIAPPPRVLPQRFFFFTFLIIVNFFFLICSISGFLNKFSTLFNLSLISETLIQCPKFRAIGSIP